MVECQPAWQTYFGLSSFSLFYASSPFSSFQLFLTQDGGMLCWPYTQWSESHQTVSEPTMWWPLWQWYRLTPSLYPANLVTQPLAIGASWAWSQWPMVTHTGTLPLHTPRRHLTTGWPPTMVYPGSQLTLPDHAMAPALPLLFTMPCWTMGSSQVFPANWF